MYATTSLLAAMPLLAINESAWENLPSPHNSPDSCLRFQKHSVTWGFHTAAECIPERNSLPREPASVFTPAVAPLPWGAAKFNPAGSTCLIPCSITSGPTGGQS